MTDVIAEFGSSPAPAWDFDLWCQAAMRAGVRLVKVQVFRASHFPAPHDEAKKPFVFPRERLHELGDCARAYGLVPGASVFDREAAFAAAKALNYLKLAAREQDNDALIVDVWEASRHHGRPVYRSVSKLDDSDEWISWPGWTTLYAIQEYPAPMLKSVGALLEASSWFKGRGLRWGWSSHTTGLLDCVLAKWLGAWVVEKHFALSARDVEAPHSLLPKQFGQLVQACRE